MTHSTLLGNWTLLDTAVVVLYLAAVTVIGLVVSRGIRNFDDFFMAGRRLSVPVLVGALVATYYGLDVTFGNPEASYYDGVSIFFAYSMPFYLAYFLLAVFVAPRIHALGVRSLPEAMGHYYGKTGQVLCAVASALYSLPVLSVAGLGLLGEALFGIPPLIGAVIGAAIAVFYTVFGGLLADSLTDTLQFLIMCVSLAIAGAFAMVSVGGYNELQAQMASHMFEPLGKLSRLDIAVYATVAMTPLVDPAFYQRSLAAESAKSIKYALLIGTCIWIAFDWVVVYLGVVGRFLVDTGQIEGDIDTSAIVVMAVGHFLPTGLLGLFVAGCIAAAMSTIDSYALVASGNAVNDVYGVVRRKQLTDRTLLLATRVGVVVTVALALVLSFRFERIRDMWIFMASILVSTILVPMLVAFVRPSLATPRAGVYSCAAGLVSSFLLFFAFEFAGEVDTEAETRLLRLGEVVFYREHLGLVTLPICIAGFIVGACFDRIWRTQ